jgi:hypothetical protein
MRENLLSRQARFRVAGHASSAASRSTANRNWRCARSPPPPSPRPVDGSSVRHSRRRPAFELSKRLENSPRIGPNAIEVAWIRAPFGRLVPLSSPIRFARDGGPLTPGTTLVLLGMWKTTLRRTSIDKSATPCKPLQTPLSSIHRAETASALGTARGFYGTEG